MKLQNNIFNLYGQAGYDWLAQIPSIVEKLSKQWGLSELTPVPNMTYNYVLSGHKDEIPIILKLGMDISWLENEDRVLNAFKGFGAVQVLASEPGALLIERADPGTSLKTYFPKHDLEAVEIVCQVMNKLHQAPIPQNNSFVHISDWLLDIDQASEIPESILLKANEMSNMLLATSDTEILLHGDLHHDNILQNGESWLVIDPKGVIGERAYEVAAFIRNPIPELLLIDNPDKIISQRIIHFATYANLDPKRIQDWCFVQAVLSWAWALEDGIDAEYFKKITEIFDELEVIN